MTARVSSLATRLDQRFRGPMPPRRLAALRVLVGGYALGYLLVRLPHWWEVARFDDPRFDPVGPLWFLDGPVSPGIGQAVVVAALVAGAAFVAGWRWRLSGPAFAVLFLAVTTYRNSWGQVFHTENLVALHLVLLAVAPSADAWSADARRRSRRPRPGTSADPYGWPVRLICLVTVLAYLVTGWAKVRNGGANWVLGDVLRHQVAHDNLRKALMGDVWSPFAGGALRHGWIFPPMAAAALAVELSAPLALARMRVRAVWAASAWFFHVGVLALMAITFPYQLSGIAFAPFFPVERLPQRVREAWPSGLARRAHPGRR